MIKINHRKLLKEWRMKKGITQKEAAEILCVAKGTYHAYETGRYNINEPTGEYIVEAIFRDVKGREFRGCGI